MVFQNYYRRCRPRPASGEPTISDYELPPQNVIWLLLAYSQTVWSKKKENLKALCCKTAYHHHLVLVYGNNIMHIPLQSLHAQHSKLMMRKCYFTLYVFIFIYLWKRKLVVGLLRVHVYSLRLEYVGGHSAGSAMTHSRIRFFVFVFPAA